MRKVVVQLSQILLAVCVARIVAPGLVLNLMGLDFSFAAFGSLVALGLIAFTAPSWDHVDFSHLLWPLAIASFGMFAIGLSEPTLWGERATYIPVSDLFVVLESGVVLSLAALQKKQDALPVFTFVLLTIELFGRRLRGLRPTPPTFRRPRYS